ncbi:MAG: hypothetical protein NTW86_24865, partial [Candidatus Sumerlaeota bacterium]|nr:hypothetical protein [Candidatus Sumerlaeota bacterium]
TAGFDDHCLRVWSKDSLEPLHEVRLGEGTLALCTINPDRQMLLRIDENGSGTICVLDGNRLTVVSTLVGKDYRVAVGPSPEDLEQARLRHEESEVSGHLQQGREHLARGRHGEIEPHIGRLLELGREKEAYGLRLEQALARGNALEELKARIALSHLPNQESDPAALMALASLLGRFGLFEAALSAYEQIPPSAMEETTQGRLDDLLACRPIWSEGRCVMDSEEAATLEDAQEAASFLDTRFACRWMIAKGQTISCRGAALPAQDILRKCVQVFAEKGQAASVPIRLETYCWMGRGRVHEAPAIVFCGAGDLVGLEVAIRCERLEGETIASPYLLLAPDPLDDLNSIPERNRAMLNRSETIRRSRTLCDAWYGQVMSVALEAVRRLGNERRSPSGGA